MNIKHQEAGRIGGLTTLMRYGNSYFSDIGKMGGRPRATELRQQSVLAANSKETGGRLPNRLGELKELWQLHNKKEGVVGV